MKKPPSGTYVVLNSALKISPWPVEVCSTDDSYQFITLVYQFIADRVPASAGVRAGMSALPGGR